MLLTSLGWDQTLRDYKWFEEMLGISFRDKELFRLALTHSSYLNENNTSLSESNERLEFLGDSVLGVVITHELFSRHKCWSEGELTQARSALVQGRTLAQVACRLGLGNHLYMGKGEEAGGGRERLTNLAAVLEALVGALFIDQGYDVAKDFVLKLLSEELADVRQGDSFKNPKVVLQEAVQATGISLPKYEIVEASGQDHAPEFTVEVIVGGRAVGRGTGPRKSDAEKMAASEALRSLMEN